MGLFDFFKGNKKPVAPTATKAPEQSLGSDVKFETRMTDRQMVADKAVVQEIAKKIIAEDPFVKPYQGRVDVDFRDGERRIFEFEEVTTMNVAIEPDFTLVVEGIALGKIPADKVEAIKPYFGSTMLTAFVYVIGGRSKQIVEGELAMSEIPYGLDIYLQFN